MSMIRRNLTTPVHTHEVGRYDKKCQGCRIESHPWAMWPWQRCRAVAISEHGVTRCELKRGHDEHHRAEHNNAYDIIWPGLTGVDVR